MNKQLKEFSVLIIIIRILFFVFGFFKQCMWVNIRQFPYKNVIDGSTELPVLNPEIAINRAAYLNEKLNTFEKYIFIK